MEFRALRDDLVKDLIYKLDAIADDAENDVMTYVVVMLLVILLCSVTVIW